VLVLRCSLALSFHCCFGSNAVYLLGQESRQIESIEESKERTLRTSVHCPAKSVLDLPLLVQPTQPKPIMVDKCAPAAMSIAVRLYSQRSTRTV
jgi:hypothetical protein